MDIKVFDLHVPPEDADAILTEHVWPTLQPHWSTQHVLKQEFTVGYINKMAVYYVADDTGKDDGLVVRLFGETGEGTCPRDVEFLKMQISHEAGTFPRVRAVLENGVIYEYAKGRMLTGDDISNPRVIKKVASALAQFHWVDVSQCHLVDMKGKPTTFERHDGFIPEINKIYQIYKGKLPHVKSEKRHGDASIFKIMEDETPFLESYLTELNLPIANVHGELNNNNILLDEDTGNVTILDYEFSGQYCPAMYDLSHVFNSYLCADFIGKISCIKGPVSEETRRLWVRTYLRKKYELQGDDPTMITDTDIELWMTAVHIMDVLYLVRIFALCAPFLSVNIDISVMSVLELVYDTYLERKPRLTSLREKYMKLKASLNTN